MRTTFIDSQKEAFFINEGYHVVNIFDKKSLDKVKNIVREFGYGVDNEVKYRKSTLIDNKTKKIDLFRKIYPYAQLINKHLYNYKIIQISIFDKLPGGGSISFHQHPNLVDETKYCSLSTWIPLNDTTIDMGTLHIVKGSHRIFTHIRTFDDFRDTFKNISEETRKRFCTPLVLKAGQAVIFDDRLVHTSPANNTSTIRTVVRLLLIPREAILEVYYRTNSREMIKYTFDDDYYQETTLGVEKPDYLKKIRTIQQPIILYNTRDFISMMHNIKSDHANKYRSLFQKLFR